MKLASRCFVTGLVLTACLCLLLCSACSSASTDDVTTDAVEEDAETAQNVNDSFALETVAFNGFEMSVPQDWVEEDRDYSALSGVVQLKKDDNTALTVNTNTTSNHSGGSIEFDESSNTVLMDLAAGRGTQVDVEGHVGCVQEHQYGSGGYVKQVSWVVGDTYYTASISYPSDADESLRDYVDSYTETIRMTQ